MEENPISAIAGAWKETMATAGKVIDQLGTVGTYFEGLFRERAGLAEDNAKYRRWENRIKLYDKTQKLLAERGIEAPTREVPMKVALPLLGYASLEEDDELQNIWARLLANATEHLRI